MPMVFSETYLWHSAVKPWIIVMDPPDLRLPHHRRNISRMVRRFESTRFSVGSGSTNFFLREYIDFLSYRGVDVDADRHIRGFYNNRFMAPFLDERSSYRDYRGTVPYLHFKSTSLNLDDEK